MLESAEFDFGSNSCVDGLAATDDEVLSERNWKAAVFLIQVLKQENDNVR